VKDPTTRTQSPGLGGGRDGIERAGEIPGTTAGGAGNSGANRAPNTSAGIARESSLCDKYQAPTNGKSGPTTPSGDLSSKTATTARILPSQVKAEDWRRRPVPLHRCVRHPESRLRARERLGSVRAGAPAASPLEWRRSGTGNCSRRARIAAICRRGIVVLKRAPHRRGGQGETLTRWARSTSNRPPRRRGPSRGRAGSQGSPAAPPRRATVTGRRVGR
jgi:hypothetical protein